MQANRHMDRSHWHEAPLRPSLHKRSMQQAGTVPLSVCKLVLTVKLKQSVHRRAAQPKAARISNTKSASVREAKVGSGHLTNLRRTPSNQAENPQPNPSGNRLAAETGGTTLMQEFAIVGAEFVHLARGKSRGTIRLVRLQPHVAWTILWAGNFKLCMSMR